MAKLTSKGRKKLPKKTKSTSQKTKKKVGRPPKKKVGRPPKAVKKKVGRPPKKKRGRPKGSKNKTTKAVSEKDLKKIELQVLNGTDEISDAIEGSKTDTSKRSAPRNMLEQIMFKLPCVLDPLIGTPKQVQKDLDGLVLKMQKSPNDNAIFDKIHLYMHGYLINVTLKKFPFIRGLQTVDIYQETLIALRFKAIPNFRNDKGMSFLNFAKMCIRRHLITLLNASKNRKKDQSINQAISLDSSPIKDGGSNPL